MTREFSVGPYRFPIVWNPTDHMIYVDEDPEADVPQYNIPLMDAGAWSRATGKKGMGHDSAGGQVSDPLALSDIFFNGDYKGLDMYDAAVDYFGKMQKAKAEPDRRKARDSAGAVITSLDFTDFQNLVVLGENLESQLIKEGILSGLFPEIATPQLGGKWAQLDSDIRWTRNLGESMSPEPSGGTGTIVSITVPKHGGAVAITQRAQDVINGDNPFARLVALLQRKRLEDENQMVAAEIQANTANTFAGVDYGAVTGSPPASVNKPDANIYGIVNLFEGLKARWNLFISKGQAYWEFVQNDFLRGLTAPIQSVGSIDGQVGPYPAADGVTWARDNAITSATAGWALNDSAIKKFRGPNRAYTVSDPDTETTRYVTKTHFYVKTIDTTLVYMITGITA